MPLTKEQVARSDDLKVETVKVPEWGGEVCIRSLMGFERDKFEQGAGSTFENVRASLAALVLCDPDGTPWYDAETAAYKQACHDLGRKNASALDRIWDRALKLNRMRKKDVEELAKNSEVAPSGASGSESANGTASPSAKSSGS